MSKRRVIVLALDAASPRLLRAWASDGTLPNLRSLMERGLAGDIAGLDGFFIGSTWPSFYTGVNPGRHGFHYQLQLVPGTYRLRPIADGEPTRVDPFWRTLSDAGRRVAILDVPLSKLDPRINGVQVVEWGVHDDLYGFGAAPEGFAGKLLEKYGAHPVGAHCDGSRRSAEDYEEFTNRLVRSVATKARMTGEVLAQEPWDFLIQVFSESHCVGHQCWHLHDPTHPAFDPAGAGRIGDPVKRVYQALDRAVGQLAEDARDATLIVMSAHGMTHWYGATFLLRDILFALGAVAPRAATESNAGAVWSLPRRLWRHLPESSRQLLAPLRDRLQRPVPMMEPVLTEGIDPGRSKCFPISNGLGTGAIRLNIAGREPEGLLRPGAEVEEFVGQLTEDLLSLAVAESGEPLVDRIVRVEELCAGAALEVLPDLVIEWSRDRPVGSMKIGNGAGARVRVRHPRMGGIEGANGYGRTGEHDPGGFFVAVGPGVRSGALANAVSLHDFAPTISGVLGCPSKAGDGRPILELVSAPIK